MRRSALIIEGPKPAYIRGPTCRIVSSAPIFFAYLTMCQTEKLPSASRGAVEKVRMTLNVNVNRGFI